MNKMSLFPYFLGRIGGAPLEQLEQLNAETSLTLVDNIVALKARIKEIKEPLCNELHTCIAVQADAKLQNTLLNSKRAIFNEKAFSAEDADKLTALIPATTQTLLNEYVVTYKQLQDKLTEYNSVFKKEIVRSRNNLKKVSQDVNLQKGLLLSSQLLLQNIPAYVQKDPAAMRKKELKTEESLIKYLSRMTAKTSPFSTFTNLSLGRIDKTIPKESSILKNTANADTYEIKSHICLNNFLYGYLKSLLIKLPDIYKWFNIRPNPTIGIDGENYVFLTNSNNIESFQRIPVNPVVELFYDLVKEHTNGIGYQQLINDIIENEYFDASQEEIEGYINQLIEYGFIEYNIGVSGIDPYWDAKLVAVLTDIQDKSELIPPVIETLKAVRAMAKSYADAELEERKTILKDAYQHFRGMCMVLHEKAGLPEDERKSVEELQKLAAEKKAEAEQKKKEEEEKATSAESETAEDKEAPEEVIFKHTSNTYFHFKAEQVFYEDSTTSITPNLNLQETETLLDPVYQLLQAIQNMDYLRDDQEKMTQYFQNKYGEDANIDLMRFYEDFYRDIKKPEAEQQQKLKDEARKAAAEEKKEAEPVAEKKADAKPEPIIKVEATDKRYEQNKQWLETWLKDVANINAAGDEINIDVYKQKEAVAHENNQLASYGCFAQLYRDKNGELSAVMNGAFPGFGKMLSRFLHILDEKLTDDVRSWNAATNENVYLIENCDASFFNANLHPPLMPYEIWMPGGQNMLPAEQQLPVTALSVSINKQTGLLGLVHQESGKNAYVFDLGFQGHGGRSQLFQLLTRFSLAKGLGWGSITNSLLVKYVKSNAEDEKSAIVVRPRIMLANKLVLQRKSWYVKNELMPILLPNENEGDYFLKLNVWRKQHGLPDEVFIFITNHQEREMLKPELLAKLGRDSYKPQYINFNNPLLVNLFEKTVGHAPIGVRIEEMLPNSKQMLKAGDKKFVTEFVLQWYENVNIAASTVPVKEQIVVSEQ